MRADSHVVTVPQWRRAPATINPPTGVEDFTKRSNEYFEDCAANQTRPTLTGYALAVGLPGPTSLLRLGQRFPELRYSLSRCMMAVAVEYEEMIGVTNAAGPMFMLKNIPDFDPDEPVGAPAVQFFNDRKEILLTTEVHGAARADKRMARGLQRACAFLYMCGDGGGWEIFLPGCLTRLVSSSMIASR
jgi:hypothetical protein